MTKNSPGAVSPHYRRAHVPDCGNFARNRCDLSKRGQLDELNDAIENMSADDPSMSTLVAYTAIVNNIGGIPVIDTAVEQYVMNEPTLATFVDTRRYTVTVRRRMKSSSAFETHSASSPPRARVTSARSAASPVNVCFGSVQVAAAGKLSVPHRGFSSTLCSNTALPDSVADSPVFRRIHAR